MPVLHWASLRRAVFLGIALKLMESQEGAKEGIWHPGNFSHQLVFVLQLSKVLSAKRSVKHQIFICNSEIYSSKR